MTIDQIYAEPKHELSVSQMVEQKYQEAKPHLDAAEIAVMEDLRIASSPRSQAYIARSRPFLGAHPRWEIEKPSQETTLRRVRAIINTLRVKHHIAILADRRGYWLARNLEEAETFLDSMEEQARAAAKSYMVTFNAMKRAIGGLRDRELNLFDILPSSSLYAVDSRGRLMEPIAPPPTAS